MLEGNPYHRILPGSTSTPKKSASTSFPTKKEILSSDTADGDAVAFGGGIEP